MDLGKTAAEWDRLMGEELGYCGLAPIRLLREMEDRFTRERVQVRMHGDRAGATPNVTALSFTGISPGVNTSKRVRLFMRFVANGGDWDVNFYTAAGASGLVAHVTALADSGTAALVADNSSGIGGSITLGAAVTADATDLVYAEIFMDFPAVLPKVFTQTESIDEDKNSRDFFSAAYSTVASQLRAAINTLTGAVEQWARDRGNDFASVDDSTIMDEQFIPDGSGNVVAFRTGWGPHISDAMKDETTGGEQDVKRIVPSAAAGVFDAENSGQGAVASHTPDEKCPASVATFECVRGADTGDLGAEEFAGFVKSTDGSLRRADLSGLRVAREWSGPFGLGPIELTRTYSKAGTDGTNVQAAVASAFTFTNEKNANTDNGKLYGKNVTNGANWDVELYSSSSRLSQYLVAKKTNVATGATYEATEQRSSTLTVSGQVGSAPTNGGTFEITCQPFVVENANGTPDRFTIAVTIAANPGLYQKIMGDEFNTSLNSDTSGSESIEDDYVQANTFADFLLADN